LITIFSSRPLEHLSSDPNSYGKAVIYDAVGNIVKNLDLKKAAGDTAYYGVLWDGTNKNNRNVGPGTYLMRVKITNTAEVTKLYSEKIGIKF
jgi:flagellar hook assembly protein FlgD